MKKLFLILVSLCSFAISANAQFYNKAILFRDVRESIEDEDCMIAYVHFDTNGDMYFTRMRKSSARNKLENKGDLLRWYENEDHNCRRDNSVNSKNYIIYSRPRWNGRLDSNFNMIYSGREYIGINDSATELVLQWTLTDSSNELKGKTYYIAIELSDLGRKPINFDF